MLKKFVKYIIIALPLCTGAFPVTGLSAETNTAHPKHQTQLKNSSMGMGLSSINDWSTQMPFIDLMKQSRVWRDWRTKSQNRPPIHTDNNDWVTHLLPGQTAGTVFLVSPTNRDPLYSTYIVNYEGEGEIEYRWMTKLLKEQSKPGHHVIKVGRGNNILEITATNPKDPIRNISIVPQQHYGDFKKGAIFNPDWISLIKQFNTLRYMDWLKTNNSSLSKWEDRTQFNHRTWRENGAPFEVIVKLAKETNTNLWLNVPHLADQKFITNLAKLLKQEVPAHLDIYIEHSNEVWNWQFQQAQYANKEGRRVFGEIGPAYMRWHGMRTAQICDIFKREVFKDSKQRIHCVLGVQTAWHGLEKSALHCKGWKESNSKPCYQHGFDHIAITSYFHGHLSGPSKAEGNEVYIQKLTEWANSTNGLDHAFEQLKTGKPLSGISESLGNYKGTAEKLKAHLHYWKSVSAEYGMSLIAYEGGQHITANGKALQENKDMTDFYERLNDDPRMEQIYSQQLALWKEMGGGLNTHFVDVSQPSKWGSWGARKYLDKSSPKWDAIETFNKTQACWWQDCEIPINKITKE